MSEIRVTYSGLIAFVIGIVSLLTGIVFTLITTRSLTAEEFGTWNLIGGLITYVVIVEPIVSYWTTREIARGIESGKTAFLFSGIFSIGGSLVYIIIVYVLARQIHVNESVLLFAAILIPVMFLNRTLTAINVAWKPHSTSYGILAFESTKIPTALIFVYFLHMGLSGAILATCIAYLTSIIILIIYAKEKIRDKIRIGFLTKWIRLSWLSVFPGISNLIYYLDVVIFSIISGSVIGLAYYSASLTVSSLVAYASLISRAIYTKLLEGGKGEHLEENLLRFFYLAFPLIPISLVFAQPALFALKPIYAIAVPVVIFMTVRAFLITLEGIFSQSLLGIEKVDINEKVNFKNYVKSKLFFVPAVILIEVCAYVIAVLVGLTLLKPFTNQDVELVIYWSVISVGIHIPFTVYFYLLTKKHIDFRINSISLLKYLLVSIIIFSAIHVLMNQFLIYKNSIFEFVPNVLLFVSIGIVGYLLTTYLIDSKTRILFRAIFDELKGKNT